MKSFNTDIPSELQESKSKILLIDNDARALSLVHEMLKEFGYQVISFIDKHKAMEWYKNTLDEISLVAVGINKSGSDSQTQSDLKEINPNLKTLFYQRGPVAPGLYTYKVDQKGFKHKIDFLLNN